MDKLLDKLKRTECIGMILEKGLPSLGSAPAETSISVSQQKSVDFQAQDGSFGILCNLPAIERGSSLWQRFNKKRWANETEIRGIVETVIFDCIASLGLETKIRPRPEIFSPSIDTNKIDRTDLAVFYTGRSSSSVGAIEVKKPPNFKQKEEGKEIDMDDIGQIVQYMYDLRCLFGLRYVFGILTTYEKWRFIWFLDSDAAAKETDLTTYEEMCRNTPPSSATDSNFSLIRGNKRTCVIPKKVKICKSPVFTYSDKRLVPALRSFLYKWSKVPCDHVAGYLAKNRQYQCANMDSIDYKYRRLPQITQFTYRFDEKGQVFYFLTVYKKTGDGKIGLYSTKNGSVGVAKFILPHDEDEDPQATKERADEEADKWKSIWGVTTPVVKLLQKHVVLMPFTFHIRQYSDKLQWCSLNDWNYRVERSKMSDFFDPKLVKDDEQLRNDESMKKYLECPLSAAKEALHQLIIVAGWKQDENEVVWRHFALLPVENTVKPIMIDLTRCQRIEDTGERQEIFKAHLQLIKKSLPSQYLTCKCGCMDQRDH